MNVVVIGSGSWGTALAIKSVLAGNTTTLYCRRPEFADQLAKDLENKKCRSCFNGYTFCTCPY